MWRQNINIDAGSFPVAFSTRGLYALHFPGASTPKPVAAAEFPDLPELALWLGQTGAALVSIFSGKPPDKLPPLDLSSGTAFQKKVWQGLIKIPMGQVCTYSELAASIGQPAATRAVGTACGANPIGIIIPCHRVVAANGKLGGFSGGLAWKKRLLAIERSDLKLKA